MYFEIRVFMRFGYNYVKKLLELLWGCLEVGKLVKHDGCYIMRIMVQGFFLKFMKNCRQRVLSLKLCCLRQVEAIRKEDVVRLVVHEEVEV